MDIRCRKTSCRHNNGQTCRAKFVGISPCANCNSFVKCGEDKDFGSLMFESAPEFANSRHILKVNLHCDKTSCLFNHQCKCSANGITIINDHDKPLCGTYIQDEPKPN